MLPTFQEKGQTPNETERCRHPRESLSASANGVVHVPSDVPEKRNRTTRQGEFKTEITETNALQCGVGAAAPARGDDCTRPAGLQDDVAAHTGVAGP